MAVGNSAASILHFAHERTGRALSDPLLESLGLQAAVSIQPNTCLRSPGGREFPVEGKAQPVRSAEGEPIGSLLVFRDLASRRQLEEGLRQAQASADLGNLRNGIAHDFNNLLTVVIGFADVLLAKLDRGNSPLEFHESLTEIKSSAERAALLSQQVLALGRGHLAQVGLVDLNELLASAQKTLGRILGERIEISTQPASELPLVMIDSVQMLLAIFQLAINSREAMPRGGKIQIATRLLGPVRAGESTGSEPRIELSLTDTGVGMDADTLGRALEPFFTTKEGAKGVGLSAVASSLRNWGGDIRLESKPGTGAKVITRFLPPPTTGGEVRRLPGDRSALAGPLFWSKMPTASAICWHACSKMPDTVLQAANGRGLELCQAHRGNSALDH